MILAAGNPFISAYVQSDGFGKSIFWALFFLSILSWSLIGHKLWLLFHVRRISTSFASLFSEKEPLGLQCNRQAKERLLAIPHPFFEIYKSFKQNVLQIISRNHLFSPTQGTTLSEADLGLIESQVHTTLTSHLRKLEKNLFVLSTVVTLAPFLGLLGTVWGILLTFSQLQEKGSAASNASMLTGLSLALATTVVGLVVAIPALVGYNYLKNSMREYRKEAQEFSHLLLTAVELHYRQPEYAKTPESIV
jgi:biopolymer transport protein TolQ